MLSIFLDFPNANVSKLFRPSKRKMVLGQMPLVITLNGLSALGKVFVTVPVGRTNK
jgi:hypothetical protein